MTLCLDDEGDKICLALSLTLDKKHSSLKFDPVKSGVADCQNYPNSMHKNICCSN